LKLSPKSGLRPFDLALVSIMAAGNFAISLYVTPALMLLVPKVFVGALIMTPLNLFLSYTTWAITRKRIFTMYFFVYGLLTMPTIIWGNAPGLFKPILGVAIGLALDILATKLRPQSGFSKSIVAVVFPMIWWSLTGLMWLVAGLPVVQVFQAMLIGTPVLGPIVAQGFAPTFLTIALMTVPSSIVATHASVSLSKRLERIITIPQTKAMEERVYARND
jgi:hypothetical protein